MTRIFSVSSLTPHNLGDEMCCPFDYMLKDIHVDHVDIAHLERLPEGSTIVIGGGGLLHSAWQEAIGRVAEAGRHQLIAWGIGINHHFETDVVFPDWLDRFTLVGLRDANNPWGFVPCPSCMNQVFDFAVSITPSVPVVVYSHCMFPITGTPYPVRSNFCYAQEFTATINFLASANTVITNTYHGAYWSALLGRRVLLYRPFSNKFSRMPVSLKIVDDLEVEKLDDWPGRQEPNLLANHRLINLGFSRRVRELLTI